MMRTDIGLNLVHWAQLKEAQSRSECKQRTTSSSCILPPTSLFCAYHISVSVTPSLSKSVHRTCKPKLLCDVRGIIAATGAHPNFHHFISGPKSCPRDSDPSAISSIA